MITPGTPARITALLLGEVKLNFLDRTEEPTIEGHFALVRGEDNRLCGRYTKTLGWSPKTVAAIEALRQALEEDAAKEIFQGLSDADDVVARSGEPRQI